MAAQEMVPTDTTTRQSQAHRQQQMRKGWLGQHIEARHVLMRLVDSTGESCAGGRGGGGCRSGTVRLRADSVIELGGTEMGQHLWRWPGGAQVRPAKGESAALELSVGHCCAREERREKKFSLCRQGRKEEKQKEGKWGKGSFAVEREREREREREKRERKGEREILTLKPVRFSVIEFVRPFARPIYSFF
jgi:hypothetical protein